MDVALGIGYSFPNIYLRCTRCPDSKDEAAPPILTVLLFVLKTDAHPAVVYIATI